MVAELNDLASAEAAPLQAQPTAVDLGGRDPRGRARARRPPPRAWPAPRVERRAAATLAWSTPGTSARVLRNVVGERDRPTAPTAGAWRSAVGRAAGGARRRDPVVTDEGPGIAPADVPHIFERFYRADPPRARDPATGRRSGSGLGLTIARELLAANGGRIGVERTDPAGRRS